ncbi:MAG: DUF3078 domain-containing protein [Bacteroidota bacterium]
MKKSLFLIVSLLVSIQLLAFQKDSTNSDTTKYWKRTKQFGFNLNQGAFSDNFVGSSVASSIGIGGFFNGNSEYAKDKLGWVNNLQLKYGILSNKDKTEGSKAITRKSIDVILFDTKVTRKLSEKWSLAASGNFLSQFTNTFDAIVENGISKNVKRSGFFSPAFISESIGFEYKPNKFFNMVISPMALRQTIISDKELYKVPGNEKNYGVTPGQSFRNEVGLLQLLANFDKDIAKNVNLKFRYLAFASLASFGNIDNRFDANLTAKINKNVNVNIGLIGIYDDNQSGRLQLAQSLNFGFLFNL